MNRYYYIELSRVPFSRLLPRALAECLVLQVIWIDFVWSRSDLCCGLQVVDYNVRHATKAIVVRPAGDCAVAGTEPGHHLVRRFRERCGDEAGLGILCVH